MNETVLNFLKANIKYIALFLVGVFLLIMPSLSKVDKTEGIENRLKSTLEAVEGVGDIDVMVSYNSNKEASGAIIVAEGAHNLSIKKMLHDAAVSVLNLPEHKVQILTKKK